MEKRITPSKNFVSSLVRVKNIDRRNWPYLVTWIIYYAWVIVFTTWWTASPQTDATFGTDVRTILHSVNLLSSALFVLILPKKHFRKAALIGAVCVLISAVLFLTVKNANYQLVIIIVFGLSLGLVNAGILVPFVFVLNNTEKFYAVAGTNFLLSALVLLQELKLLNITNGMIPSLVMLVLGLAPILFFKSKAVSGDSTQKVKPTANGQSAPADEVPSVKKSLYIGSILLNLLYAIICRGVGKMFVSSVSDTTTLPLLVVFYVGAIVGCLVYFIIYAFAKNANIITWNVTFGTFVIGMLLYFVASGNAILLTLFAGLIGVGATMGMINMYYILGVIGKKHNSLKYVRVSVVCIGAVGGILGVVVGKYSSMFPLGIALTVAIVSTIVIVILLLFSPALARTYFKEDWSKDSEKSEIDNKSQNPFEAQPFSKREKELCKLLLDGMTLRQAAATMGVSYSTANTYQTSIYRKLGINSKTELMLLFKEYLLADEKTSKSH